ncbi:MAG: hypothetical protein QOC64_2739 [Solirubrobacteraceae bacterium]|nr:hypothetical protein [Solirubrobacteraceae bacterium]
MERSDERLSTRDLASGGGAADAEAARADEGTDPVGDGGTVATETSHGETAADPRETGDSTVAEGGEASSDPIAGADPADTRDDAQAADPDTAATTTDRGGTATAGEDAGAGPLVDDSEGFQQRWEQIQGRFVDEPRGAVEDADALVATVMQQVADGFASERERLEAQWGRGEDISTEDLRVALMRYRSFFQRLLST